MIIIKKAILPQKKPDTHLAESSITRRCSCSAGCCCCCCWSRWSPCWPCWPSWPPLAMLWLGFAPLRLDIELPELDWKGKRFSVKLCSGKKANNYVSSCWQRLVEYLIKKTLWQSWEVSLKLEEAHTAPESNTSMYISLIISFPTQSASTSRPSLNIITIPVTYGHFEG